MENLKTLKAMLLLAETLKYSTTYKEQLILELNYMIENEQKK
jgi:hypothetical protein